MEKIIGVGSLGLSVFGVTAWWPFSPLWGAAPILLFFAYGLLKANYKRFEEIKEQCERLASRVATDEKRIALKDLLGETREEGPRAHARTHETGDWDILSRWTNETHDLIEAAFGKGEAQLFLSDEGYPTHSLPGSPGNDAWAALAQSNVSARNRREREIGYRLRRLDSLILRADSLPIRPDFDPQGWTDRQ